MDSYDNPYYPTRGTKIYSGIKLLTSGKTTPVYFFHFRLSDAEKLTNRLTLLSHVYAGAVEGEAIPSQYMIYSGGILETYRNGILPFAGLDYMEVTSKNALSIKMDIQLRMFSKIYIIGTANAGNFEKSFKNLFTINNTRSGYGLTAGYNSIIGPMEINVSRSANHRGVEAFVRIGYWF
jgi:NTE family protein